MNKLAFFFLENAFGFADVDQCLEIAAVVLFLFRLAGFGGVVFASLGTIKEPLKGSATKAIIGKNGWMIGNRNSSVFSGFRVAMKSGQVDGKCLPGSGRRAVRWAPCACPERYSTRSR